MDTQVQSETGISQQEDDSYAQSAASLTPDEEAAVADLISAMEDETASEEIDLTNLETQNGLADHISNILLLGVDNRSVELQRGLSDAILICSINRDSGSIKLISIARDTAVSLPGYQSARRINTAYKYGGAELAMRTVNRNFHLNIQQYLVINIHGLADVIESLGGVEIDMTKLEAKRINFELEKEPMDDVKRDDVKAIDGVQHLDGMQAVTFARIRGIDSDLERTHRQRKLLEALFKKLKDVDLFGLLNLVETTLPYVQSNISASETLSLGLSMLSGETMANIDSGGEIFEQMRIPIDKHFGYKDINDASVIYLNQKNFRFSTDAIHEFIYGIPFYGE